MRTRMELGPNGRQLIQSFEKCVLIPYRDSAGVLTDGWGHTANAGGRRPKVGVKLTQAEADETLEADLCKFVKLVNDLVTVDLTQDEFDALVSFEYNTGHLKGSTLLRLLNKGDKGAVPSQLMRYTHTGGKPCKGLVNRRRAEVQLWSYHEEPHVDAEAAVDVDRPKARSLKHSKIANTSVGLGIAGGLDALNQVKDVTDQVNNVKESVGGITETLQSLIPALAGSQQLWIGLAIVVGSGLIWVWRKQHADEDGI